MQNRKASFGIFLFAKREEMPKEFCPIKITDKYLITYYDEDNLYFAYRRRNCMADCIVLSTIRKVMQLSLNLNQSL